MASKKTKVDLGAGLTVSPTNNDNHPAGPPQHGQLTQAERAFTLSSTFLSGVMAISASQFIGAPLKLIDPAFYARYMAYTKESFAVLITCLTQWWAPTVVRVSGDASMKGQLIKMPDGSLKCDFADRLVLMANHQLYTDWLYLWWIAYTNGMHGHIYIILKESIKNIPIVGWGCQFYNFIFLSRKWEEDKPRFQRHLKPLNKPDHPMWLLIFPEGTNLSATTRESSKRWADKNGLQDMKHQLLPRSTGIRFCLEELRNTTDWLYDCTIAYEGVPPGQFGQDIFTLRSSFLEGRPPKSVNMHWRRFDISTIPIDNPKAFDVWLRNRWREKDYMLEYFTRNGKFPADEFWKEELNISDKSSTSTSVRSIPRFANTIETEVKSGNWNEFVQIFAPISALMMALMLAYGASPDQLPFPNQKEFLEEQMKAFLLATEGSALSGIDVGALERWVTDDTTGIQLLGEKGKEQIVHKLTEHHLRQLNQIMPMQPPEIDTTHRMHGTIGPKSTTAPSTVPKKLVPKAPAKKLQTNGTTNAKTGSSQTATKPQVSQVKGTKPQSAQTKLANAQPAKTVPTKAPTSNKPPLTKPSPEKLHFKPKQPQVSTVRPKITPSVKPSSFQPKITPSVKPPTVQPKITPSAPKPAPVQPKITPSKPTPKFQVGQKLTVHPAANKAASSAGAARPAVGKTVSSSNVRPVQNRS